MSTDQYTFDDPVSRYPSITPPDQEQDAVRIAGLIQDAGRTAIALPGDISDSTFSQQLVVSGETLQVNGGMPTP